MKAPKRIWLNGEYWVDKKPDLTPEMVDIAVEYIRADLVKHLIDAKILEAPAAGARMYPPKK